MLSVPTELRPRMSGELKVNNVRTVVDSFRQLFVLRRTLALIVGPCPAHRFLLHLHRPSGPDPPAGRSPLLAWHAHQRRLSGPGLSHVWARSGGSHALRRLAAWPWRAWQSRPGSLPARPALADPAGAGRRGAGRRCLFVPEHRRDGEQRASAGRRPARSSAVRRCSAASAISARAWSSPRSSWSVCSTCLMLVVMASDPHGRDATAGARQASRAGNWHRRPRPWPWRFGGLPAI